MSFLPYLRWPPSLLFFLSLTARDLRCWQLLIFCFQPCCWLFVSNLSPTPNALPLYYLTPVDSCGTITHTHWSQHTISPLLPTCRETSHYFIVRILPTLTICIIDSLNRLTLSFCITKPFSEFYLITSFHQSLCLPIQESLPQSLSSCYDCQFHTLNPETSQPHHPKHCALNPNSYIKCWSLLGYPFHCMWIMNKITGVRRQMVSLNVLSQVILLTPC